MIVVLIVVLIYTNHYGVYLVNLIRGFIISGLADMKIKYLRLNREEVVESDVKTQHRIRYKIKGGKVYIAHILPQKFINLYQR